MGCDIHPVLERKIRINGAEKWVTVNTFEYRHIYDRAEGPDKDGSEYVILRAYSCPLIQQRNYKRFGLFANVRGDGQPAKGLPPDMADYTLYLVNEYGDDGHSHSWLTLSEALEHCIASERDVENVVFNENDARKKNPLQYYFGIDIETYDDRDSIDNYRLIFWFDN